MTKLIEITGKAISGEWGNDDTDGTGIPVLRTTNFTNDGVINFNSVVTRSIAKKNLEEKYLQRGDIIIEKSGGSTDQPVGRVVYFDAEENKYLFNNFTGVLRIIDKSTWFPRYVFWALYYNYRIGGTKPYQNKTTGLHNLQTEQYICNTEIHETSYIGQKRIAAILDKVDVLISLRKKQLQKLDDLVKSRFVEMFGDPVNYKGSLSVLPMTDICTIIDGDRGENYPKQEDFSISGYCLFLNAKNVTKNGFDYSNCMYISKAKDDVLRKGKLQRGDIVLTTRGTIGNLAFYSKDVPFDHVRINSGMVLLRMKGMMEEQFFIEQFRMLLDDIRLSIASGSAQPQLPISTMNKIMMIVPNKEKQRQFVEILEAINKTKSSIQAGLDKLEQMKQALMQKYFA